MSTLSDDFIICPHCEHEHGDAFSEYDIFFVEGAHQYECENCEKEFRVNTEVRYYYETEVLEE